MVICAAATFADATVSAMFPMARVSALVLLTLTVCERGFWAGVLSELLPLDRWSKAKLLPTSCSRILIGPHRHVFGRVVPKMLSIEQCNAFVDICSALFRDSFHICLLMSLWGFQGSTLQMLCTKSDS